MCSYRVDPICKEAYASRSIDMDTGNKKLRKLKTYGHKLFVHNIKPAYTAKYGID